MKIFSVPILLFLLVVLKTGDAVADEFERERNQMVRTQIQARGIRDRATLRAMRAVPRHLYVPAVQRRNAYQDRPLPIGYGQTISQPYIVAYMTEIIRPAPGQRVLEIGTGSGYQAAVLAEIIDQVYTIEIIGPLGEQAKRKLQAQYDNVHVKIADGYHGWPEHAPFDAIVVTAAADYIPPPLVEQLKEGGRMIIPVGSPFQVQQLMLVEKKEGGEISTSSLMPVRFVPFERERQ
ncbi:MAG: protein-L-isoaspartate(D-aspartate) O-methyltransferase [Bacteroidales bacterium]|nr:protein-L-isoaspartate(D-aspartate) O-methyltransferase [Bacteroidales bacterium]